jgi:hypothetical protein
MKTHIRILLYATALLCSLPCFAAQASASDRAELLRVRESVWRAWFANDAATLERLLPAETLAINAGEEAWQDRRAVLAAARDFRGAGGTLTHLTFPRTEIQLYRDVAVLYSQYEIETAQDGKSSRSGGRVTEVFVKRDGRWVNTGWHMDSGK